MDVGFDFLIPRHGGGENHRGRVLRFRIALRRPIHLISAMNRYSGQRADAVRGGGRRSPALIAVMAGAGIGPVDERGRAARALDHADDGLRIRQARRRWLRMRAIPVARETFDEGAGARAVRWEGAVRPVSAGITSSW